VASVVRHGVLKKLIFRGVGWKRRKKKTVLKGQKSLGGSKECLQSKRDRQHCKNESKGENGGGSKGQTRSYHRRNEGNGSHLWKTCSQRGSLRDLVIKKGLPYHCNKERGERILAPREGNANEGVARKEE